MDKNFFIAIALTIIIILIFTSSQYQKRFGFTGVVVSHAIPDIFYISQRIAMLEEGRILFEGTPEEIQSVSDSVVREFIRGIESRHDEMTGLAHMSHGEDRFNEEMARLHRHDMTFSIIVFSISNLDEINEKASHITAQTAVKNFAMDLKRLLRLADVCSRYELDKVMVLLPHTTVDQARRTCEKLSGEMHLDDILPIQPYPGFCFQVSAGFVEAEKDQALEQVLDHAMSRPTVSYEFRVC